MKPYQVLAEAYTTKVANNTTTQAEGIIQTVKGLQMVLNEQANNKELEQWLSNRLTKVQEYLNEVTLALEGDMTNEPEWKKKIKARNDAAEAKKKAAAEEAKKKAPGKESDIWEWEAKRRAAQKVTKDNPQIDNQD